MQRLEDRTADVSAARAALRSGLGHPDRLNKRFYSKLKAVTHGNAALAKALAQIITKLRPTCRQRCRYAISVRAEAKTGNCW